MSSKITREGVFTLRFLQEGGICGMRGELYGGGSRCS